MIATVLSTIIFFSGAVLIIAAIKTFYEKKIVKQDDDCKNAGTCCSCKCDVVMDKNSSLETKKV
jgi:hypothetical protein